ncbi:MAG: bifunctional 4-hydroxy-2-oxoglutarate aldolase/2-dehydro-3-deoxy-phosphogluconate aldolase [Oscillospiraceae bacterium]|jgi:2-dehydro-3-deoxyphosphogluconate aldolase/(4S)-4-hydroxy-2-oxoglutarate aldolase|nr:bifunctional 4-hydroxy-2-oxoglutarate aldolase/2-dehydro-3-deoxy-phosphogluconate aldolase [Oscillospiraceae bacterium]
MLDAIGRCGIVPVIKITDVAKAVPLARALLTGGVGVIEVTFRTAAAPEAIAAIARKVPEMLVGAGTVLTPEQLAAAKDAGARFIVSPGLDADIVKKAQADGLTVIPGVVTPSEICAALKLGLTALKFFPAQTFGGAAAIKALAAPFAGVRFVPTGGIGQNNAPDYWKIPQVLAVGGTWMAPEHLIDQGDFDTIERMAAEAARLRRECGAC